MWTASFVATVAIAQQIASKALRDGLFLTEYEVTALPVAVAASAALSFVAAIGLGRLMSNFSPAVAVPLLFGVNALLFFAEAVFVERAPVAVAGLLYLHTAAFGGAVVSGFWSVVNERFDPYTARRVMGRIAGGATLGGMLGGALTWLLSDLAPMWLLSGLGVASVTCAAALLRVGSGSKRKPKASSASLFDGFKVVTGRSYPRSIAVLVFLIALSVGLVDYVFKAGVAAREQSLVGFFAMFYTGTGVVTFLLQTLVSRRILKWVGVVPTVGTLPATLLGFLLFALMVPGLFPLILLRGVGMVAENSLYRSGYELLYAASPPSEKRSAKILIDLGCDRLGTAAASGLALVAVASFAAKANHALLVAALLGTWCALGLLVVLRRQYVSSLAQQIRGASSEDASHQDASMAALASTFVGSEAYDAWSAGSSLSRSGQSNGQESQSRIDRQELMETVQRLAKSKSAEGRTSVPPLAASTRGVTRTSTVSERLLDTPLLRSLEAATDEPADGPTRAELLRTAPAIVGQLTDVLLSGRRSVAVRALAAELLSAVPSERTVAGLLQALSAPEFRVRRCAALALLETVSSAPALRPRARVLSEFAGKELQRPSRRIENESEFERGSPFRVDARGNTIASSLELALVLLAVRGDREGLRLALSAVTSPDPAQRGTGLEYLDNLLPGNLRTRIVGLVENPELAQTSASVSQKVIARLAGEMRKGELSVRELRRQYRQARQASYDQV